MLFDKKMQWHSLPQGGGLQALCELPIPGDEHLVAQLIIQAEEDARVKELREAAETLRLAKPRGSTPK